MRARGEAIGWALICGACAGTAFIGGHQAFIAGDPLWAMFFLSYAAACLPVYAMLWWPVLLCPTTR